MRPFNPLFLLLLLCAAFALPCCADSPRLDSLLCVLDHEVAVRGRYAHDKQAVIDSLNRRLPLAKTDVERWNLYQELFDKYKYFSMDTALLVARRGHDAARRLGNDTALWRAHLMLAQAHKDLGNYQASLASLDSLPSGGREHFKLKRMTRYVSVFYSLYQHACTHEDSMFYAARLLAYRDSLNHIFQHGSVDYQVNNAEMSLLRGEPLRALGYLDAIERGDTSGVVPFTRARALLAMGRSDGVNELLAEAAIRDLRHANRKYEALQMLADLLNDQGQDERAYRYILCSIEDILASHSVSRLYSVADNLPIIVEGYEEHRARDHTRIVWLLVAVSLLVVGMAFALWRLVANARLLAAEREKLSSQNTELLELKTQLDMSVKAKEGYIGLLFTMCANYMEDWERGRSTIMRKLKTGKIADVEAMLAASQMQKQEHDFLTQFDRIFLDIYPDFVERFNELLRPDERISLKRGELLTPELRIYALVRLGITDSVRIAQFLRYSPQTVYNYRLKMRNRAAVPRDELVKAVQQL